MKRTLILAILSSTLSYAGDYDNGEILYFQKGCTACHGNEAQGLHNFPKLANIPAYKLRKKLLAYRADKVKTPQASIMTRYAKNLKKEEMEDIIEYLANYTKIESDEAYDDSYQSWGDGGS
jgi:cytochrome c553